MLFETVGITRALIEEQKLLLILYPITLFCHHWKTTGTND